VDDVAAIGTYRADPAFTVLEDLEALRGDLAAAHRARPDQALAHPPQLDISAGDIGQRIARLDVVEVLVESRLIRRRPLHHRATF
jgi:hypothetical protein